MTRVRSSPPRQHPASAVMPYPDVAEPLERPSGSWELPVPRRDTPQGLAGPHSRVLARTAVPRRQPANAASGQQQPDPGPRASELTRSSEPTSVLLWIALSGALAWGLVAWRQPPRPAVPSPIPAAAALAVPAYSTLAAGELLRWADDPRFEVRRQAVLELGRRGALGELNHLRYHPRADVRASVPLAVLEWGPAAHRHIPWLAEGLESNDAAVRRATATALTDLVHQYGAYRETAAR